MESGDGLIVRLRPRRARLAVDRLRAIARLARAAGNGVIDLTRRANLQLRGVSVTTQDRLRDELVKLGLADATPEAEGGPGLLVCPLEGLDPRCPPLTLVASELEQVLASFGAKRGLSHKFGIVLSGGSKSTGAVLADLHVRLHPEHPGFAELILGGTAISGRTLGLFREREVAPSVAALLEALIESGMPRLRQSESCVEPALRRAVRSWSCGAGRRPPAWSAEMLGLHAGDRSWLGVEVPYGSASAEAWTEVAALAERFGAEEVRFTSERQVLLPDVHSVDREQLGELQRKFGFYIAPRSRGVELVACSGAPACRAAHGETRRLASELGSLLAPISKGRVTLHVSGCEKSCARGEAADVTLVRGAEGLHLGFGVDVPAARVSSALSQAQVVERLQKRFSSGSKVGLRPPIEALGPSA